MQSELLKIATITHDEFKLFVKTNFDKGPWIYDFPDGCCDAASILLHDILKEKKYTSIEYQSGNYKGSSRHHQWLRCGKFHIDITLYQFDEKYPKVVIDDAGLHAKLFTPSSSVTKSICSTFNNTAHTVVGKVKAIVLAKL